MQVLFLAGLEITIQCGWYSLLILYAQLSLVVEPQPKLGFYLRDSLACQTFILPKGEEKYGNLPIPFWFAEFGIILCHINGMLILCCHVQCT